MKKTLALLVASTAVGPAFAADIIEYIPPPAPVIVAAPSWTGLYVGGQAGYAFHDSGSSNFPGGFINIPGIPGTPGEPGTPPVIIPGEGGTFEYSYACASVDEAAACAVAIEGVGTFELTRAELSAAAAQVGEDVAGVSGAGEFTYGGGEDIVLDPGTPGTPGTPGVPGETIDFADLPGVSRFDTEDNGFIGGVHIGYDYQLGGGFGGGAFVIGAIADLSYVDIERGGGFFYDDSLTDFGLGDQSISVTQELDYLATLRLRAGLGFERALVYATGGLAFGDVETTLNTTFEDFVADTSNSETRFGYSVGGGVEFLVASNFSLGVEYLYTDLGSGDDADFSYSFADDFEGLDATATVDGNRDFDFHTIWAKASYRFN